MLMIEATRPGRLLQSNQVGIPGTRLINNLNFVGVSQRRYRTVLRLWQTRARFGNSQLSKQDKSNTRLQTDSRLLRCNVLEIEANWRRLYSRQLPASLLCVPLGNTFTLIEQSLRKLCSDYSKENLAVKTCFRLCPKANKNTTEVTTWIQHCQIVG